MANNTATIKNSTNIYINDIFVYKCPSAANAQAFLTQLKSIFSDPDLDLDFITPISLSTSSELPKYGVCCARVRRNTGETTYFRDHSPISRKLYATSAYVLYTIEDTDSSAPWYQALKLANAIRYATKLNYDCARENNKGALLKLVVPTNTSSTVAKVINSSCSVQFYGHPDQGTKPGLESPSATYKTVENIYHPYGANSDVIHPCDITAAITKSNGWSSTYMNKYVKVSNGSNRSLVVRITDEAPEGKGIELTWHTYCLLGKPSTVKIELMN